MNQTDWKAEYEKLRDIEPPNERLRGGLKAVGRSYHDMAHNPDVSFVDCDEHMCVKVRALLRDTACGECGGSGGTPYGPCETCGGTVRGTSTSNL